MIKAENLYLRYEDGTIALKDVNLSIPSGKVVFITGHSGSGKTSFLKLLMGMESPTEGDITVLERSMKEIKNHELRELRRSIGPIFQDFKLLNGRTVLDNVLIGMRFLDFSPKEMKENAIEAIEKVGLSHKTHSSVDNLSYGERQRVAIARAVCRKPKLIVADEPTGNLDKDNSLNILELLKSFRDENTTVIITTHATHLLEDETDYIRIKVKYGEMVVEEVQYESNN